MPPFLSSDEYKFSLLIPDNALADSVQEPRIVINNVRVYRLISNNIDLQRDKVTFS